MENPNGLWVPVVGLLVATVLSLSLCCLCYLLQKYNDSRKKICRDMKPNASLSPPLPVDFNHIVFPATNLGHPPPYYPTHGLHHVVTPTLRKEANGTARDGLLDAEDNTCSKETDFSFMNPAYDGSHISLTVLSEYEHSETSHFSSPTGSEEVSKKKKNNDSGIGENEEDRSSEQDEGLPNVMELEDVIQRLDMMHGMTRVMLQDLTDIMLQGLTDFSKQLDMLQDLADVTQEQVDMMYGRDDVTQEQLDMNRGHGDVTQEQLDMNQGQHEVTRPAYVSRRFLPTIYDEPEDEDLGYV